MVVWWNARLMLVSLPGYKGMAVRCPDVFAPLWLVVPLLFLLRHLVAYLLLSLIVVHSLITLCFIFLERIAVHIYTGLQDRHGFAEVIAVLNRTFPDRLHVCAQFSNNSYNGSAVYHTETLCGVCFSHPLMSHNSHSWSHISPKHWPSHPMLSLGHPCLPQ